MVANIPLLFKPKHVNLEKLDELDVRNRFVSIIHGLGIMFFSGYHFYRMPGQCGDSNTLYEKRLAYTSIGYFFYDFAALGYYGLVDQTMTIHHLICILGMSSPLTYGKSANYIVMGMYIAEISNSFMHVRCILRHYGMRYTKAYECSEITFMLLYFYGRIILGASVVWSVCDCQHNSLLVKTGSVGLAA